MEQHHNNINFPTSNHQLPQQAQTTPLQMAPLHSNFPSNHQLPQPRQMAPLHNNFPSNHQLPQQTQMTPSHNNFPSNHQLPQPTQMTPLHNNFPSNHQLPQPRQMAPLHNNFPSNHQLPQQTQMTPSHNNFPSNHQLPQQTQMTPSHNNFPSNYQLPQQTQMTPLHNNFPSNHPLPQQTQMTPSHNNFPSNHQLSQQTQMTPLHNNFPSNHQLPQLTQMTPSHNNFPSNHQLPQQTQMTPSHNNFPSNHQLPQQTQMTPSHNNFPSNHQLPQQTQMTPSHNNFPSNHQLSQQTQMTPLYNNFPSNHQLPQQTQMTPSHNNFPSNHQLPQLTQMTPSHNNFPSNHQLPQPTQMTQLHNNFPSNHQQPQQAQVTPLNNNFPSNLQLPEQTQMTPLHNNFLSNHQLPQQAQVTPLHGITQLPSQHVQHVNNVTLISSHSFQSNRLISSTIFTAISSFFPLQSSQPRTLDTMVTTFHHCSSSQQRPLNGMCYNSTNVLPQPAAPPVSLQPQGPSLQNISTITRVATVCSNLKESIAIITTTSTTSTISTTTATTSNNATITAAAAAATTTTTTTTATYTTTATTTTTTNKMKALNYFKAENERYKRPELRDVYRYVVPEYAHEWKYLGILLKFEKAELDIIFSDYRNDSKECCRNLLSQWLEKHHDASWDQLFLAINDISSLSGLASQASQFDIITLASVLKIMRNHLCDTYKRTRFTPKGAEWPPNIPKLIVSVALIHYKGKRTQQELFEMASVHKEGASAVDKFIFQEPSTKKSRLDYSRVTKNVTDIFAADPTDIAETDTSTTKAPKRILIEGAPGIGKTVLAKEISYQWATNGILTEIKIIFLLYLRDPQLQSITTTKQLVEYMSMGCLHGEKILTLVEYLVNTQGQQLCIVMDGFDEFPNTLQENSFIVDIINRAVLPEAIVVITSRPTATVSLHDQVDRRIDILGLPKEEREKYISQAFINAPDKKIELERHLKQRPVINGFCFVPLHLAILLYLFDQGCLPETLTEMNESFILHTIYRHLKKDRVLSAGLVDKLAKVPKPVLDVVYKLSKLAFDGLKENKLIFTFDEVKEVCPHVDDTVGAINGFGLLQAVQHYPSKGAGTTTSLNFLHYTMQEFLSALHVSNLPSKQQSSLMKKTFWDGHYNFMWMMFIGIVGIKSDIFVNFVSKGKEYKRKSGIRMAENILSDKRKRLHVFQCYMEAKSSAEAPDVISDLFKDGEINIKGVKLLPHHISSLMTYVSNPSMQWNTLQLNQCNITDIGMSVLEQFISEKASTLESVDLSDNNSSPWGVYCAIIRHCGVDSLTLCGDKGIEDYVNEIKDCLQMKKKLMSLKLCNITDIGAVNIAEAIQMNSTLQNINISKNHISTEGLLCFLEAIKNNCTLRVVNITHNNVTRSGFTRIKQFIDNLQHPMLVTASWNEINKNGRLVAKILISSAPDNIEENVWYAGGDPLALCLSECLKEDDAVQVVCCDNNGITSEGAIKIAEAIKVNKTVQELDISSNNISDNGAAAISDALKSNNSLQILKISYNKITNKGAIKIAEAIKVDKKLQQLLIWGNNICDNGAAAISDALKNNNSLKILDIADNKLTSEGATLIAKAIKVNTTLHTLDLGQSDIDDAVSFSMLVLTAVHHNNTLMNLRLPRVYDDDERLVSSEVKKINKERSRLGISTLTCYC